MKTETIKAILSEMEEHIKTDCQEKNCMLKISTYPPDGFVCMWVTHIPEPQRINRHETIDNVSLVQDCLVVHTVGKFTLAAGSCDESHGNRDKPAPDETLVSIDYIPCDIIRSVQCYFYEQGQ